MTIAAGAVLTSDFILNAEPPLIAQCQPHPSGSGSRRRRPDRFRHALVAGHEYTSLASWHNLGAVGTVAAAETALSMLQINGAFADVAKPYARHSRAGFYGAARRYGLLYFA